MISNTSFASSGSSAEMGSSNGMIFGPAQPSSRSRVDICWPRLVDADRVISDYVGSFSKPSIELAARLGCGLIVAPFAAAMSFGGLQQVADLYHQSCAKYGTKPDRLMCSYFTHFADDAAQEAAQRARQI